MSGLSSRALRRSLRAVSSTVLFAALLSLLMIVFAGCGGAGPEPKQQLDNSAVMTGGKTRDTGHAQSAFPLLGSAAGEVDSARSQALIGLRRHQLERDGGPDSAASPRPAQLRSAPAGAGLPGITSLKRGVSALPEGQAICFGNQFDNTLPSYRIQINDSSIDMLPDGDGFENTAYAIFRFNLPGFAGTPQVETFFDSPPDADDLFVAVADFTTQDWRWMQGDTVQPVLLPAGDFLSDSGDVLVAVLVRGVAATQLSNVRFGGNRPPVAVIAANPSFADAPFTAELTAQFSNDPDGSVVKYEWDLDGDGTYELDKGGDPETGVPVSDELVVGLRITDDEGQTAVAEYALKVDEPGYDEVEPNDVSVNEDNFLPSDFFDGWEGNIGSGGYDGGDRDGYAVYAATPRVLHFRFDGASGSGLPVLMSGQSGDTGEILAQSNQTLEDCRLDLLCATPGYYLLIIQTLPDSGNMDYTLSCSVQYGAGYDELENNDAPFEADPLSQQGETYFRANLGAAGYDGDSADFFSIAATANHACRIRAEFPTAAADIDMELLAPDGVTVLASSTTVDNTEVIEYLFPTDGDCFLRCFLKAGSPPDAESDYYLSLDNLGEAPTASLTITPESGEAPLTVTLDYSASTVGMDKQLDYVGIDWDNDGIEDFTSSEFTSFGLTFYAPGTYTVWAIVHQTDGMVSAAHDEFTVNGALDEVEPNDAFDSPNILPDATFSGFLGSIGPGINQGGNDDYFFYTADADGTAKIQLFYNPAFPAVRLYVYSAGGGPPLAEDNSADGSLEVNVPVSNGTELLVLVWCDDNTSVVQGYSLSAGIS